MQMHKLTIIINIAYADFLERIRRYSFLVTLAITVFMGLSLTLKNKMKVGIMSFGGYRGIYNTAWIACSIALVSSTLLSLFGFYLVKDSIDRDKKTGVGQIISCSAVTKLEYCTGKALSNIYVLSVIMAIMIILSAIMQFIKGEDITINIWALIAPFIYMTLPTIVFISSLAILFETIKMLRGSFGNIVYFFMWMLFISLIVANNPIFDMIGGGVVIECIINSLGKVFSDYKGGFTIIGTINIRNTFYWSGVEWTAGLFAVRYLWVLLSYLIIVEASKNFNNFSELSVDNSNIDNIPMGNAESTYLTLYESTKSHNYLNKKVVTPVYKKFRMLQMVKYEIILALKGHHWIWYALSSALIISPIIIDSNNVKDYIKPIIFLFCGLSFCGNADKELNHNTGLLAFSTSFFRLHQLMGAYFANVLIFIGFSSGIIIRSFISGGFTEIIQIVITSLLIPSVFLTVGIFAKSSRLFETIFILFWYIGPMQKTYPIDFVNFTGVRNINCVLLLVSVISLTLLSFSYFRRNMYKH